jgi:membrane protease YdiL (CAAX protease family)
MNILILLSVAVFCICLLWAVQSLVLVRIGEPLAWPLRYKTEDPRVKFASRIMVHTTWIIIIVATPLLLGISPVEWLRQEFPTPVPWRDVAIAFLAMLVPIWAMYALWLAVGWVRIEPHHDDATRRAKLFRRFIGPWPLALLEESVFRGIVLEQFLRSLPPSAAYTTLAIVVSSLIFSSIHFVRRPVPGRVWLPAYGLFIVGCLFGLAYVVGGRSLWLPIAMHGAAVFGIQTVRLYVVFKGPVWLLGYPEFPQCGVLGSLVVLVSAIALVVLV